jgi:hypothetical protein
LGKLCAACHEKRDQEMLLEKEGIRKLYASFYPIAIVYGNIFLNGYLEDMAHYGATVPSLILQDEIYTIITFTIAILLAILFIRASIILKRDNLASYLVLRKFIIIIHVIAIVGQLCSLPFYFV